MTVVGMLADAAGPIWGFFVVAFTGSHGPLWAVVSVLWGCQSAGQCWLAQAGRRASAIVATGQPDRGSRCICPRPADSWGSAASYLLFIRRPGGAVPVPHQPRAAAGLGVALERPGQFRRGIPFAIAGHGERSRCKSSAESAESARFRTDIRVGTTRFRALWGP